MKKVLCLMIGLISIFLVGCNGGENSTHESKEESSITKSYTIEYCYWDEDTQGLKDIPVVMWKENGNYPTQCEENTQVFIDDLCDFETGGNTLYEFNGWYYDMEYTNPLVNNSLSVFPVGDSIILYAKITQKTDAIVKYTISYCWKSVGESIEGIENFPEAMTKGLDIPLEYKVGETVRLPQLNSWKKNSKITYEFEGWYYDESLKNKVVGDLLLNTQTGNLTLYAKVAVYIN